MTEQTSASDRYEAARKALDHFNEHTSHTGVERDLASALRALITPPNVGQSEATIAGRILDDYFTLTYEEMVTDPSGETVHAALMAAARAGIQSAHETWECETALRPSQEQMLRWLGIEHEPDTAGNVRIHAQIIGREEM